MGRGLLFVDFGVSFCFVVVPERPPEIRARFGVDRLSSLVPALVFASGVAAALA